MLSLISNYFWLLWFLVSTNYLYYSIYLVLYKYMETLSDVYYTGNYLGTIERRLDALEANPISMVFRRAARSA